MEQVSAIRYFSEKKNLCLQTVANKVGYYLVEERGWALDLAELERSYQAAKVKLSDILSVIHTTHNWRRISTNEVLCSRTTAM